MRPLALMLLILVAVPNPRAQQASVCDLLKPAEIQAVSGAAVGAGVAGKEDALHRTSCEYRWTAANFHPTLLLRLGNAAAMWPGMTPAQVRTALLGGPRGLKPNESVIPGVGEAAVYTQSNEASATVVALAKGGRVLELVYSAPDEAAKKNGVIGLVKAALGRL